MPELEGNTNTRCWLRDCPDRRFCASFRSWRTISRRQ